MLTLARTWVESDKLDPAQTMRAGLVTDSGGLRLRRVEEMPAGWAETERLQELL